MSEWVGGTGVLAGQMVLKHQDAHHKGEVGYATAVWSNEVGNMVPDGPMFTTAQDARDLAKIENPEDEFPVVRNFVFDGEGNWVRPFESVLMTDEEQKRVAFWHRPI
jgi:hypothetical protein